MQDLAKRLSDKMNPISWNNTTNYQNGFNSDIQKQLMSNKDEAVKLAEPIAHYFKGATDSDSLLKIHTFIRSHLGYRRDPKGKQQIKLPNRFLLQSGDCKSNALFVYAIASNLGIPVDFKFANYKRSQGNIPSHVYNVAFDRKNNTFVFVDGTSPIFGRETKKPFFSKLGGLMKIQTLSDDMQGIANRGGWSKRYKVISTGKGSARTTAQQRSALTRYARHQNIGWAPLNKFGKFVKKTATKAGKAVGKAASKVGDVAKKGILAAPRAAFLGLVMLNVHGFASSLKKANQKNLQSKWTKDAGGSWESLKSAINTGSKKKGIFGLPDHSGEGIGVLPAVLGAVATATPIIVKLSSFLGNVKDLGVKVDELVPKKVSNAVNKVKSYVGKSKNLQAKYKNLTAQGKANVVNQVAQQTGQSPAVVAQVFASPGMTPVNVQTGSSGSDGSASSGGDAPDSDAAEPTSRTGSKQEPANDDGRAQRQLDGKKKLFVGLGIAAVAGTAIVLSKKKSKRKR